MRKITSVAAVRAAEAEGVVQYLQAGRDKVFEMVPVPDELRNHGVSSFDSDL